MAVAAAVVATANVTAAVVTANVTTVVATAVHAASAAVAAAAAVVSMRTEKGGHGVEIVRGLFDGALEVVHHPPVRAVRL